MTKIVCDASVVVKWLLREDGSGDALKLLHPDVSIHVPDFVFIEVDNVLCTRVRRDDLSTERAQELRGDLRRLPLRVSPFMEVLDTAYHVANHTRHSIYDCIYVALACVLEAPLVTSDERLVHRLEGSPYRGHVTTLTAFAERQHEGDYP